jgi:hypothetical protein
MGRTSLSPNAPAQKSVFRPCRATATISQSKVVAEKYLYVAFPSQVEIFQIGSMFSISSLRLHLFSASRKIVAKINTYAAPHRLKSNRRAIINDGQQMAR